MVPRSPILGCVTAPTGTTYMKTSRDKLLWLDKENCSCVAENMQHMRHDQNPTLLWQTCTPRSTESIIKVWRLNVLCTQHKIVTRHPTIDYALDIPRPGSNVGASTSTRRCIQQPSGAKGPRQHSHAAFLQATAFSTNKAWCCTVQPPVSVTIL